MRQYNKQPPSLNLASDVQTKFQRNPLWEKLSFMIVRLSPRGLLFITQVGDLSPMSSNQPHTSPIRKKVWKHKVLKVQPIAVQLVLIIHYDEKAKRTMNIASIEGLDSKLV